MKRLRIFLIATLLLFTVACTAIFGNNGNIPVSGVETAPPATSTPLETTDAVEPTKETPVATNPPATTAPTESKPPMAGLDDEPFALSLAQAIESLDFDTLRSLMKERFSGATWNTELREFPADEALQRLRDSLLAPGSVPKVQFGTDVVALLGGSDPLSLWGPVANPVRAMHVTGLGPDANIEAILVIGRDQASGQFYWHGILVPQATAFQATSQQSGEVVQTDVEFVVAKEDLNIRSGPGENYAVEGLLSSGEVVQVTGKSADGVWWQITCNSDASGHCWVSAIPTLSEPVDAPER